MLDFNTLYANAKELAAVDKAAATPAVILQDAVLDFVAACKADIAKQRKLSPAPRQHGRKPWCRVIEVGEDYTTQTCGKCGKLHKEIGRGETFCCPQSNCDFTCDRDVNGARNMILLLRYLTTQKIAVPPGLARLSGAFVLATASATTTAPPGHEGPATAGVRQALSSDARQPAAPEQEAGTPAPPGVPAVSNRRPFRRTRDGIAAAASRPHWSSHALEGHEVVLYLF
jgi:putative transposase